MWMWALSFPIATLCLTFLFYFSATDDPNDNYDDRILPELTKACITVRHMDTTGEMFICDCHYCQMPFDAFVDIGVNSTLLDNEARLICPTCGGSILLKRVDRLDDPPSLFKAIFIK